MASTPVYAKFIHNGRINTIALIDGLSVDELTGLLKTVFTISGSIVGIMAEKGLVIPISLVCKSPQVIPNNVCKILVAGGAISSADDIKVAQAANIARSVSSTAVNTGTSVASVGAESSQAQSDEDDSSVEWVIQEILRFIEGLVEQKFLNKTQFQLLYNLLSQNSTLLFAAYSVAISANDSEYFAEICKDLSNSLTTEQGRSACEAQDEVLQVCDQLYINERITESQLLYLRHLVLIREEVVANVYDEFQEHQSVPLLAKALFEIANSHPFQTTGVELDEDRGSEGLEDESEAPTESSTVRQKALVAIARGLTGVISLMSRAGVISKTETNVLFEMVDQENDYVIAAYELYEKDRNLDELQDTLLRCVRLEIRKRVTEIQEEELESLQKERDLHFAHAEAEADEEEDEEDDDDEENYRIPNEEGEDDEDDDEEEEDEKVPDDEDDDDFSLEDITLDSILSSLGIDNIWQDTVPEPFVQTVFIAVIRRQLDFDQAKALCDLFHANYDLVRAAWEVYTVQEDASDFVDTLRRIVKDLDLDELQDELKAKAATSKTSTTPSTSSAASAYAANAAARGKEERPPSAASSQQQQTQSGLPSHVQEARAEAMKAVVNAKRELLKHSLEMMVKQGITSADRASDLYSRYLEGDVLIEAAIESYASDRDVAEFLDTLQILCNHSKEDIEALMHAASAAEEQEKEESNSEESSAQSPTSRSEIALLQITDIVKEMLKNDMIGPAVAEMFQKLIKASDPRLISAYEKYTENKNGAELVDTLLRVVVASVEGVPKSPPRQTSPSKSSPSKEQPKSSPVSSPTSQTNESILDANDQKKVVEILFRARGITAEQFQSLNKLIEQGNPTISRIFAAYENDKNVYKLIDSLKTFESAQQQKAPEPVIEEEEEEEDESEEEQDEEDDDNDEDNDFDDDDAQLVETRFMQIVQSMKLTDLETAALRLAIAENDPAIRTAIENFRDDLDEDNLKNAMRQAARAVIQRTLSSRVIADDDSNDGNVDRSDDEDDDEEEESQNDEEDDEDAAEDDEGNQSDTEDEEDGGDNDDDNDFNGKSLITPQRARDTVFPILVQELVKESILTNQAGKILLEEFNRGNNVINAALDVYDVDNDMAKLVETLQTFVDDVNGDDN